MALFDKGGLLRGRAGSRARRYLREFFEVLSDPARFEQEIVAACTGGGSGG